MLTDAQCRNAIYPPDRKWARFTDAGALYPQRLQALVLQIPYRRKGKAVCFGQLPRRRPANLRSVSIKC